MNRFQDEQAETSSANYSIEPFVKILCADARHIPLKSNSIDLIVTSPPYWKKRDYGVENQIGQENSVEEYVEAIVDALREWRRILKSTGSIFLNIGDTYVKHSLLGIPSLIEAAARADKWIIRNRIIWAKQSGLPVATKTRLANRHEYILHLTTSSKYYYDVIGYSERYGNGSNPGDVWYINPSNNNSNHLAPFPEDIPERAIILACPKEICSQCGQARTRVVQRGKTLNPNRPQARRAMEIANEKGLTDEHIAAIQATGISDAGKAKQFQNGSGRNSDLVQQLAAEAKEALGGYFREFTFPLPETVGWSKCRCNQHVLPGVILDPFMGTGTTLKVAGQLGFFAIGCDLKIPDNLNINP